MRRRSNIKSIIAFLLFSACLQTFILSSWPESPYPEPEAKEWLNSAPQDILLHFERFSTKQAADRFLDKLYRAGALYIGIISVMGDVTGLRIYLPLDADKRKEILEIANYELTHNDYPAENDRGQDEVVIWF